MNDIGYNPFIRIRLWFFEQEVTRTRCTLPARDVDNRRRFHYRGRGGVIVKGVYYVIGGGGRRRAVRRRLRRSTFGGKSFWRRSNNPRGGGVKRHATVSRQFASVLPTVRTCWIVMYNGPGHVLGAIAIALVSTAVVVVLPPSTGELIVGKSFFIMWHLFYVFFIEVFKMAWGKNIPL